MKQVAQKEQWHRNIIISLALLPPHQCCISHTPRTAWMSGVALFSSTLTQFTSAPWANASAMWGRFFSKAAWYNCNPGLGCLESQNTGDSCLSPSKKKKIADLIPVFTRHLSAFAECKCIVTPFCQGKSQMLLAPAFRHGLSTELLLHKKYSLQITGTWVYPSVYIFHLISKKLFYV